MPYLSATSNFRILPKKVWHTSTSIIPCIFVLMTFKEKIYQHYLQLINEKIRVLQQSLHDLTESAGNETKRTAGDKHETALAMLQIEQENSSRQLKETLAQKKVLEKIDAKLYTEQIVKGSLITTHKGIFFLSIGLGKATIDHQLIIALSPESPLGKAMLHLKTGDTCRLNGIDYLIEGVE